MDSNNLYPIFLKVHQLNVLIIGAGNVGAEKLRFLLKSSPDANVEIVANQFSEEVISLSEKFGIELHKTSFVPDHLNGRSLVISATNNADLNAEIYSLCKQRNILINVADTPSLCDFYLGGIVTKGNLKIAISTNGKSPTMAKRMRQYLEQEIPDDIDESLDNLHKYRTQLRGDFKQKVDALNAITKQLIND